jgi:hypothetical protein
LRHDRANESEWTPLKGRKEGLPILGGNPFWAEVDGRNYFGGKLFARLFGGLTLSW